MSIFLISFLLRFEYFCFVFTLPKIFSLVFSVPLSPLLFSSMLYVRFRLFDVFKTPALC